ncbi:hypothetical protein [Persicobacter sp. CCB-QB2]|uniref:hypothetical protein n=1 Tax=Persicobacter sp. CCB-QB2 TaxID=1561025 RepID=UPI0006A944A3|nr:hypothetical protein [Persicobacter sp. CCB-QB2]
MPKYRNIHSEVDADGNLIDDVIDENDRTVIGNPHPIHYGGLTNTFRYKNFDLSIFMNWSFGNDVLNANRSKAGIANKQQNRNYMAEVGNRWTPDNAIESGVWGSGATEWMSTYNGRLASTYFVEDGSFLRIQNITLGYNLPKDTLRKLKMSSLRIAFSVENAYVFTNYSGYDPEVSVKNHPMYSGIDWSAYPRARSYNLSLNMGF